MTPRQETVNIFRFRYKLLYLLIFPGTHLSELEHPFISCMSWFTHRLWIPHRVAVPLFSEAIFLILFKRLYVAPEPLHNPLPRKDPDKSVWGCPGVASEGLGGSLKLCSEVFIQEKAIQHPLEMNAAGRTVFQGRNGIKIQIQFIWAAVL